MSAMKTRTLGRGLEVSALGLGCMALSVNYGQPVDKQAGIALIRASAGDTPRFQVRSAYLDPGVPKRSSSSSISPHRSGLVTVISRDSPGIAPGGTRAVYCP